MAKARPAQSMAVIQERVTDAMTKLGPAVAILGGSLVPTGVELSAFDRGVSGESMGSRDAAYIINTDQEQNP